MDPVSLALAAVGVGLAGLALFEPAVKACFEIYGIYELSHNYGRDYQRILRSYKLQVTRTAWMMTQDVKFLVNIPGPNTADTQAVLEALAGIRSDIIICEELMKKHGEPPGPRSPPKKPGDQAKQKSETTPTPTNSSISNMSGSRKGLSRLLRFRLVKHSNAEASSSSGGTKSLESVATKNSTASNTTAESSTSQVQEIGLSGQVLQQTEERFDRDAAEMQQNATRKTPWILSEKKEFEKAVHDICCMNDLLQDRLMIKFVTANNSDPSFPGLFANYDSNLLFTMKKKQLFSLHKAFQAVNGEYNQIVSLSVPLRNEPSEKVDDAYISLSGNKIKAETTKYIFYAHKDFPTLKEADLIIAELSPLNYDEGAALPCLKGLRQELMDVSPETIHPLQCVGRFEGGFTENSVCLFQDVSRRYHRDGNLTQMLKDESWRSRDFQADHVRLARWVAELFVFLEKTFPPSLPKASAFVFYETAKAKDKGPRDPDLSSETEEDGLPSTSILKLSKLSLVSSFGATVIRDTTSLLDATQNSSPSIIVALGLILYQIGSWRYVRYKMNVHGLEEARADALLHITDVDKYLPGQFTRAVEACLRWKEDELNSITPAQMLERLAASLRNYESDLRYRF